MGAAVRCRPFREYAATAKRLATAFIAAHNRREIFRSNLPGRRFPRRFLRRCGGVYLAPLLRMAYKVLQRKWSLFSQPNSVGRDQLVVRHRHQAGRRQVWSGAGGGGDQCCARISLDLPTSASATQVGA